MDKLTRWLVALKNDELTLQDEYYDFDLWGGFGGPVIEVLREPEPPKYGVEDLDGYLSDIRRRMNDGRTEIPDKTCMEYYNRWCGRFIDRRVMEMSERLQRYQRGWDSAVFGCSMEYLEAERRKTLYELLECCCVNDSHVKTHEERDTLEGYRRELGGDADDETVLKYAFFRRFFRYTDRRYALSERRMMARHLMLNVGDGDEERIMLYFECCGMMKIIQGDMDELSAGDEYRLSQIRSFYPSAVLEYVGRISRFAHDAQRVRSLWCRLMMRSDEIVRRFGQGGRTKECFEQKNEDFSREFVCILIGKMKSQYGLYNGTFDDLAEAMEQSEAARKRTRRYMNERLGNLNVTPASIRVIDSILG